MNLTIDQGNSRTKVGFFNQNKLTATYNLDICDLNGLKNLIDRHRPRQAILSSVLETPGEIVSLVAQKVSWFIEMDHQTPVPFRNLYKTPATLGKDRLAALVGAQYLYPRLPLLVIDAGTAITFDLLVDNAYVGGNISPGLTMRFRALHDQTGRLPRVKPQKAPFWGTSTTEAMAAGVQNGVLFETEAYCNQVKIDYPSSKIIITGGDADFFAKNLKNIIFVHPNLVLIGLNHLIEYNV